MNNPVHDQHADVPIPAQKDFVIRDLEDTERYTIQYDPRNYTGCEAAAKAFYEALKTAVIEAGQKPDSELAIMDPETSYARGYGRNWCVMWEAGPYQWGTVASMSGLWNCNAGWFTEPYYSFDVCFTE